MSATASGACCGPTDVAGIDEAPESGSSRSGIVARAPAPVFLTTAEAAQILRWIPDTVRRKASAGKLPCMRLGRHWRFDSELLYAYIRGEWAPANAPRRATPFGSGEAGAAIFRQVRPGSAEKRKGQQR